MILSRPCWVLRSWTEPLLTCGRSSVSSLPLRAHLESAPLFSRVFFSPPCCSARSRRVRRVLQKCELDPAALDPGLIAKPQHRIRFFAKDFCFEAVWFLCFLSTLQPISNSPPKWMADLESEDIEMLKGTSCFCRPDTGLFNTLIYYAVPNLDR